MYLLIKLTAKSPYLFAKKEIKKNLAPLETKDKAIKTKKLISNIPELKQVILQGNGENPPIMMSKSPNS